MQRKLEVKLYSAVKIYSGNKWNYIIDCKN